MFSVSVAGIQLGWPQGGTTPSSDVLLAVFFTGHCSWLWLLLIIVKDVFSFEICFVESLIFAN